METPATGLSQTQGSSHPANPSQRAHHHPALHSHPSAAAGPLPYFRPLLSPKVLPGSRAALLQPARLPASPGRAPAHGHAGGAPEHDHPGAGGSTILPGVPDDQVAMLQKAGEAVGRIEVDFQQGEGFQLAGTAWLIRPDLAVTCRHVVLNLRSGFCLSVGYQPPFRSNIFGEIPQVEINFGPGSQAEVEAIWWVETLDEDLSSPDLAFLKLKQPVAATPLEIGPAKAKGKIAVIQYPVVSDPTGIEAPLQHPGQEHVTAGSIIGFDGPANVLDHTASTYGGSSGGPLIDLESGKVVGMHAGGHIGPGNRAVLASAIEERLISLDYPGDRRAAA